MDVPLPLVARGIGRSFRAPLGRRRVVALDGFDLRLRPGEVAGLVGPNGSGKTTAIRCCLGLLRPTAGSVRLFGAPPGTWAARQGVGYAPERFDLARKRSGRETLVLLAQVAGLSGRDAGRAAGAVLERLALTDAAERHVGAYSKGMVRRLAIAAALLGDPRLLVLDEPFDGLDPLGNLTVRDELERRARDGVAVLVSSHALADLEAVATHLCILARGRTLLAGPRDAVLTRPGRTTLEVEGVDPETLAALAAAVAQAGGRVVEARPARETLEELFRRELGGPGR